MQKITPCLWFEKGADEAVTFYLSVFKNAKVVSELRYTDAGPLPAGTLLTATLLIEGHEFIILNGGSFVTFNSAVSFLIKCSTQEEVDYLWEKLSEGGKEQQCGWLVDKFGVTWQVVPEVLYTLLSDTDAAKLKRVTEAMFKMVKLDINMLVAAAQ